MWAVVIWSGDINNAMIALRLVFQLERMQSLRGILHGH
jgi:hypothetical protein